MLFSQIIKNRRSIRAFKDREIEKEKLEKILKTAQEAPSAGNLQAWRVLIVKEKEKKEKLAQAARNQTFIIQAPVILVFLADQQRSAKKYGFRGIQLYALQDATLAAIFAWLEAVAQGLASCWVGAFEENRIRELFNLPSYLQPIALLPLGYPKEFPPRPPRLPLKEMIFC